MKPWSLGLAALLLSQGALATSPPAAAKSAPKEAPATKSAPVKLVTVGPAVTETVFALGMGEAVVGVDDTSLALPMARGRPKVGYQRALASEPLIALGTTALLASEEAGPPGVLEQLRSAGLDVVILSNKPTLDEARNRVRVLAKKLGRESQGEALVADLEKQLQDAAARVAKGKQGKPVRILALYARGANALMVAGKETPTEELIRLAGGVNAVTEYSGHRPLTAEGVIVAAPDIILVPDGTLTALGGEAALRNVPGLSQVKGWKVTTVEDVHFMSLGPNLGKAVQRIQDGMGLPARDAK
ncbi:ABC transporter substrate-binding protein [Myxococcus sp. K38C18041901]|uniref:heme/hemin ABC transporter substrate-binding protein n=1 Tax=Myxococcus guangdongensis TaxID=2906760 RepID=UPI0020A740DC|nr:ABC transporter substrate-binding protein [Myxococcus guangdongensis]MCP3058304.1 ABC transporter substrate-binding protein [Myxococcus guangdongensis]